MKKTLITVGNSKALIIPAELIKKVWLGCDRNQGN